MPDDPVATAACSRCGGFDHELCSSDGRAVRVPTTTTTATHRCQEWAEAAAMSRPPRQVECMDDLHEWEPPFSAASDLCAAMVMRDGAGDECGLPRNHPVHRLQEAPEWTI